MKWGTSVFGRISAVLAAAVFLAPPAVAAQDVANPPWPARCPLELGLLVDQSDSMGSRFGEVREATRNVIDALRDKPSRVTVIGFGTTARTVQSDVDVSDTGLRRGLKDDIDQLDTGDSTGGATNWDAALATAESHGVDVAVLITDGMPTAYGDPALDGPEDPLAVATATADRLKSSGTRVVAVGIDLPPGGDANLAAVTGPQVEQDYFTGEQSSLLRRLYDIVASACGVPITALPQPEGGVFPWQEVLAATLAAALAIGLIAFLRYRRRRPVGAVGPAGRPARQRVEAPSAIDHRDLTEKLRDSATGIGTTGNDNRTAGTGTGSTDTSTAKTSAADTADPRSGGTDTASTDTASTDTAGDSGSPPARRSMSLDFLDRKPPTTKDNNP
ncbi:VWA domain-containing protein [Saccharothrix deserti]|uniref:VWA domain-containing protein n=1 Tax=Saccharothrix deserti TaxID=2593674 RepID=UPI00131A7513|nr:vWA domain-containing protein [Saccharothrix deserti]